MYPLMKENANIVLCILEDEYHSFLVCPKYRDTCIRAKYLKPYFCHWPSLNKFEYLMSSSSVNVINNCIKVCVEGHDGLVIY